MVQEIYDQLLNLSRALAREESGQDVLEYALTIAGIAVAVAAVLIVGFVAIVPGVLDALCPAVDPLGGGGPCVIR